MTRFSMLVDLAPGLNLHQAIGLADRGLHACILHKTCSQPQAAGAGLGSDAALGGAEFQLARRSQ
jgi:hypothetical protein